MARERIATAPSGHSNRWSTRASESIGSTRVLTFAEVERFQAFQFEPTAASVNLDLPAEESSEGAYLFIKNAAAATNALAVRDDAAGAVVTIAATKAALVWCDGTTWLPLLGA